MMLSARRLSRILQRIKHYYPGSERVSAHCLPRNVLKKSVDELAALRELGLSMVYVGCESGDDEVLRFVNKGETSESSKAALLKLKKAGIAASIMIFNGMGGRRYSHQHAVNSARLMNEMQREYLATLVVSFPAGDERFRAGYQGNFEPLQQSGLFEELALLLAILHLNHTVFRSDHASNYLVLKGTLGEDKARLLGQVNRALNQPGSIPLQQERQRGL